MLSLTACFLLVIILICVAINLASSEAPKIWRKKLLEPAERLAQHSLKKTSQSRVPDAERALKEDIGLLLDK